MTIRDKIRNAASGANIDFGEARILLYPSTIAFLYIVWTQCTDPTF